MFSRIAVSFHKYWVITLTSWSAGFAYPVSFWMWRARQMLQTFISLSFWTAVYSAGLPSLGYTQTQMLTYIFVSNLILFVIAASRTIDVVNVINSGDLSLYLVKPFNFFANWFSRDLADKLQNIVFAAVELTLLYLIFRPEVYVPANAGILVLLLLAVLLGLVMFFFINMIFGFIGFWSPDSWAPRFLFFTVMGFTSGALFPLDIFPPQFVRLISLTPFPYLTFFQTKIWLNQLSTDELQRGFFVLCMWLVLCYLLMITMWRKGIRGYGSEGR